MIRVVEHRSPRNVALLIDPAGHVVRFWREAELPVTGEVVRYRMVFTGVDEYRGRAAPAAVRYLDPGRLSVFLREAGLAVAEQFGDWGGRPLTDLSGEIITVAVRAPDGDATPRRPRSR